MNEKISMTSFK